MTVLLYALRKLVERVNDDGTNMYIYIYVCGAKKRNMTRIMDTSNNLCCVENIDDIVLDGKK